MKPIAIVTVTYSPGQYLRAFLDSVPAATQQGAKVVLVDNGSVDGAPEAAVAADRTGGVELHYSGGNVGYGAAMNLGIRLLQRQRRQGLIDGDFVLISNPDVVFEPGAIDALIDVARNNPRAGSVGPLIREADGSAYPSARAVPRLAAGIGHALLGPIWPKNPWTQQYRRDGDLESQRVAGWLSGSCLLLRWEAFASVGGFDERYFMYMEDVDLGDRLGRAGWLKIFAPSAQIRHAKGHAAGAVPEKMLPAHHESAYRFNADRLPGWRYAPIRLVLRVGLGVRSRLSVWLSRR
ncbi:glycosyltransferase family 2 protein [Corynebacterium heidelbergense]|uniref:Alpha-D-GlcNAc-diphosphoryl polyprenol, alpha-3-L-rhamnosyl transferase n=1 Tax=Corynebacterium heidelbergense TaxID=2055947 RepID=A0A364V9E8_9CORY|nr:glycosyltransferase family 2 protein [Corynebacterium heidelbergense]RAV33293.1 alpha-D-GlcNAc-diphosphoryl polyprenol, alpha-3-L-rhamnosyl transferase [Corynebacterium heidelbergense]